MFNNDGTAGYTFGLYFFNSLFIFFVLSCGTMIHFIPATRQVCAQTASPNTWNIGSAERTEKPGLIYSHTLAVCPAIALKFALEIIIPFGFPVVPPL